MKISLCIPMYNERAVIEKTARTLDEYMKKSFPDGDYEVIFCDDGSRDGCGDIVRDLKLPNIKVIGYSVNRGKGYAVRTAFLQAKGDIVMFTDADLAYGTEVIERVYNALSNDPKADLLIGSRNLSKDGYEGYTLLRKIASKVYIKVLCIAGGFKLSDSQCGCKAFKYDAVQKIFPRCEVDRFAFDFEALLWASKLKYKITEMPVSIKVHGDSKVRIVRDTLKMLRDILKMKKRIKRIKL